MDLGVGATRGGGSGAEAASVPGQGQPWAGAWVSAWRRLKRNRRQTRRCGAGDPKARNFAWQTSRVGLQWVHVSGLSLLGGSGPGCAA